MMVECYGTQFDIPDVLIDKFTKDFDVLPGSANREGVYQIRESIAEIVDIVGEDPELLHEHEYLQDFIRALAMRQALNKLGVLYDS